MLPFAEVLAGLRAALMLRDFVMRQVQLGKQNGLYTDEQVAQIKAEAGITDAAWDAAVAAAKARLAGG